MEEEIVITEVHLQTFETSLYVKKLLMFEEKCKPGDHRIDPSLDILDPMQSTIMSKKCPKGVRCSFWTYMVMKCPHGTFERFKSEDQKKNANDWSGPFLSNYSLASQPKLDYVAGKIG